MQVEECGGNNNQTPAGPSCKLCGYQNNNTDRKNPSFHLLEVIDNPERLVITYQCPSCSLRVVEAFQGNVGRIKVILEGLVKDLIRRIGELKKGSVDNGDPPPKPAAGSSSYEGCSAPPPEQRDYNSRITSSENEGSPEGNDNDDKESEPPTPMHDDSDDKDEKKEDYVNVVKDEKDEWVDRDEDAELSATEESEEQDDDSYMRDEVGVEVEIKEEENKDEYMDIGNGKDRSEEAEENDDDYLINEGLLIKSEEASATESKPVEKKKVRSRPGRRCHQCPMLFRSAARLHDHIERMHGENPEPENPSKVGISPKRRKQTKSSDEKKLSCDQCEKTFHTKSQRNSHIRLVHMTESQSHDCLDCPGISFRKKERLHRHRISIHQEGEWPYVCPHSACEKGFFTINELRRHKNINHSEGKRVCPKKGCGKEFAHQEYLNSHLELHKKGIELLKCSKCPKEFDNFQTFKRHERRHRLRETKKYPCPYPGCGKKFPDTHGLNVHSETHSEERKYKCEKCGKTFKTQSSKNIHVNHVHGERPFKCPQCPMTFKGKGALVRHLCSNHEQEWPFLCPTPGCGKGFLYERELKEHNDTWHSSEGDNVCRFEGCRKEFANRKLLKAHEKLHANGIGSLKCEKCGKDFYNSQSLKLHEKQHERSENKNLPCPYCPKMFANQRPLQDHINRHKGVRKYQCESCGRSFSSTGNLRSHQQLVHEKGGKPRPSRMGDLEKKQDS